MTLFIAHGEVQIEFSVYSTKFNKLSENQTTRSRLSHIRVNMYVFSATVNVSCSFDDVDICGYQDLSETGIHWLQILYRMYMTISNQILHSVF